MLYDVVSFAHVVIIIFYIFTVIYLLITRMIVIKIAPLRSYFLISRCFVIARSLIWNCPLLEDISCNTKCLLVWCD